jgi:hypothetical protein
LLVCGESSQPVGVVVMEAPSMLQAHANAVARDLAGGLAFGEVHELSTKMAATIPPEQIDRMLSGKEAAHMIVRLVEGRGRPEEMTGRFPRPWRMVERAAGFIVQDATGQNVAWFHFRSDPEIAQSAAVVQGRGTAEGHELRRAAARQGRARLIPTRTHDLLSVSLGDEASHQLCPISGFPMRVTVEVW